MEMLTRSRNAHAVNVTNECWEWRVLFLTIGLLRQPMRTQLQIAQCGDVLPIKNDLTGRGFSVIWCTVVRDFPLPCHIPHDVIGKVMIDARFW